MNPPRPPKLAYDVYLDAIALNVATLTQVLGAAPADVAVPSCPGWSLADLGAHAGDFAAYYSHRVCDTTGATRPPWPNTWKHGSAAPLNGETPAAYFDDRAQFLLTLLRATPADAEVRTWNKEDQSAHFVARRSTHEFAVHRVDAELARGTPQPIDAAIAVDGIEEIFTMLDSLDAFKPNRGGASGEILHIHARDAGKHWLIALEATLVKVTDRPATADLTLSGAASDLELLLYGRPTVGNVERAGSDAVIDMWYRTFTFT